MVTRLALLQTREISIMNRLIAKSVLKLIGPNDFMYDVTKFTTQRELDRLYSQLKRNETITDRQTSFRLPVLYEREVGLLEEISSSLRGKEDKTFEFYPDGIKSGRVKIVGHFNEIGFSIGNGGSTYLTQGTGGVTWDTVK